MLRQFKYFGVNLEDYFKFHLLTLWFIMKKQSILLAICFIPAILFSSCTRDKNEPMPQSTVSRLYVSNADTDAAVLNTIIFDPADQSVFPTAYSYNSQLPDGNGILFDPFSGTVFQVSRKNRNIRTFTVNTDGTLANKNSFIDEGLTSARELAFDRSRNMLYIASNTDSAIYVYNNANTLSGSVAANKKLKLNGQPWGIHLDGDRLFVVIDQDRVEVQLFESASTLVVGTISPTKKITISGAIRLHGITYSEARDALILTDIADPSSTVDGAVYIIDGANVKFTGTGTVVTPSRVISGINTGLGNPVDVAWDDREGKDLIYIAEKANRKILIFRFTDKGNVAPAVNHTLSTFPEALYIDAR